MKNSIKFRGIELTPNTDVKLVKFDETPHTKRTIKIKDITRKHIQDVIDLYKDLYISHNGRDIQVSTSEAGRILLNLTKSSSQVKNHINKFIDFETAVEKDMNNRSLKISID